MEDNMELEKLDPKGRFSSRVHNYVKYRPSYPKEIIEFLQEAIGLSKDSIIADVGSGTGISAKLFLDNGNTVYAVEPNRDMRQAAEGLLQGYNNFYLVDGSSENTTLKAESIDVIVAAQAFHWFDPEPTKEEFLKILKPEGYLVLLWNKRKRINTGFMGEYLNFIKRYGKMEIEKTHDCVVPKFFNSRDLNKKDFSNSQHYNFERLKGELASFSYMPNEDHKDFVPMMVELENIFNKYNDNGKVVLEYETEVYYCKMK